MPFYHYEEDYNGSAITVSVERDTGSFESSGGPVPLHTILGMIDSVEQVTEDVPLYGIDNRPGLKDRLLATVQILKNEIDSKDEFAVVMEELSFISGSEPIMGFALIPGSALSGEIDVDWDTDADLDSVEIIAAELSDHSDAAVIAEGGFGDPYTMMGVTGTMYYIRMRGQRTGDDWGPYTAWLSMTAP